jgi:uncharacterized protein YjiS (DUF1127 family)
VPRDGTVAAGLARQGTLARLWCAWRKRAYERRQSRLFTDRDLWDVGLTRGDLYREFSRPFWRADWIDPTRQ